MTRNMFNIISCFVVSYSAIYFISFMFFKVVSVDAVIGLGVIILFYLFYFFGHKQISSFLLSQNKGIFMLFVKLIYLVTSLKFFILSLNESYLNFLWYKFNGLKLSITCVDFVDLKLSLLKNYNINRLYNIFFLKLLSIEKFAKNLNAIDTINNNDFVQLNILLNLEFIQFLKNG